MDSDERIRAYEAVETLQALLFGNASVEPEKLTLSRRRSEMVRAAESAIALRSLRCKILGQQFASDPCWDLLLCLYTNWVAGSHISVTDLGHVTGIPSATVTRWLSALACQQMIARHSDPNDGRRIWIKLTQKAISQVEQVLSAQAFGGYCRRNSMPIAA